MPEAQELFLRAVSETLGVAPVRDFSAEWLVNKPLQDHFRERYMAAMAVFDALNGDRRGLERKQKRRLNPDAYLPKPYHCLIEYDEVQHFTQFKQRALEQYPSTFKYGFDVARWLEYCEEHWPEAEAKGAAGYRKPKVEFPFEGGRHAQRAFLDMIRDFVPSLHGLRPTVRICEFEFNPADSPSRLKMLIESRLV